MKRTRLMFLPVVLLVAVTHVACDTGDSSAVGGAKPKPVLGSPRNAMKISLKFNDKTIMATLDNNETARDFASLLPLTLNMGDLFGREKYGRLPRAMSDGGKRQYDYEIGHVIYWSPGPDVAIYYKDDGEKIPAPGIIVIGKVDSEIETLNVPGSLKMTISLIADDERKQSEGEEDR